MTVFFFLETTKIKLVLVFVVLNLYRSFVPQYSYYEKRVKEMCLLYVNFIILLFILGTL